ncbi:putative Glutathione S-transferase Mu 1 [Hypsibius exemplaris]|uniref:glutathione transferase n=1 Tax=Hypsibius exemplaris TaxID=2072580 RepID=A0A1W0X2G1_HYPEX|nr:putative Glutathione S-transferase Mu 1 [Hypsibius exemplaris]
MVVTIGYWDQIRGRIQDIRLLLENVGEKYEFQQWSMERYGEWFQKKESMPFPFPNLPYLIDGDVKLTQSRAIMQYLGRKHGLAAVTEPERQQEGVIDGVLSELREKWTVLMYASPNFEEDRKTYETQKLRPLLKQLDCYLADKEYLVGNRLTYNDFTFYELVDYNQLLIPGLLDDYPNVKKLHQKIPLLPGIKEFLASDRSPNPKHINGGPAPWGKPGQS